MSVFELGFTSYLLILVVHFMWAGYIVSKRIAPLGLGPIQHPALILLGLLILNVPSMTVFLEGSMVSSKPIALGHVFYHILLAFDEGFRVRKFPVRGVFLVNHLYWAALIYAFVYFDKFPRLATSSTLILEALKGMGA